MNIRQGLANAKYLPRALHLTWQAAGGWFVLWMLFLVLQGAIPAVTVYLSKPLLDHVSAIVGAGFSWATVEPALLYGALMAGILLIGEIASNVGVALRAHQAALVHEHVAAAIHQKSTEVDLAFYESPEYHDRLNRAQSGAATNSIALLDSIGGFISSSIALIGLGAVIVPYGWWLSALLLLSTLPALVAIAHHQGRRYQWWKESTVQRRWADYYSSMLTSATAASEVRLYGWGPAFQNAFRRIKEQLRRSEMVLVRRQIIAKLAAGALGLLIFCGVLGWMCWRAANGYATLGDLARFYQAFSRGQSLMQATLASTSEIFSSILFVSNLFEFLEIEPRITDPKNAIRLTGSRAPSIRFNNVTFAYPDSERAALSGFNLEIKAGETIAIVGENGAGKSTLVKLLCRYYDPERGSIEIDGIDLRSIHLSDLRRTMTVMFQVPVQYHATVAENISISSLSARPDDEEIRSAAAAAGAHEIIERLPQGYHTLLGKVFADGTELSGGERQRIALARAFLRRSPVVILDEPTSFMDSWAEADWLERFRDLVQGRTAIIITHRFTTAMRADRIFVMEGGRIVESGTHESLMECGGRYARSWKAQTRATQQQETTVWAQPHQNVSVH